MVLLKMITFFVIAVCGNVTAPPTTTHLHTTQRTKKKTTRRDEGREKRQKKKKKKKNKQEKKALLSMCVANDQQGKKIPVINKLIGEIGASTTIMQYCN